MEDSLYRPEIFIGKVLSVFPEDYTMSVMPFAGRMGMYRVRVLTQNATTSMDEPSRGYFWMPHINDTVVCAFIEGMPEYPVCLGVLFTDTYTRPPQAATKTVNGVAVYQQYDYVVQHQTGSYIRMRNNNQPVYNEKTGVWTEPTVNLSEVTILQQLNNSNKTNKIELKEISDSNATIKITHHSGAEIQINNDGDIIVTPATSRKVLLGGVGATEGVPFGALLKTWLDTHTHTTGMGPSGPPIAPASPSPSSTVTTL